MTQHLPDFSDIAFYNMDLQMSEPNSADAVILVVFFVLPTTIYMAAVKKKESQVRYVRTSDH